MRIVAGNWIADVTSVTPGGVGVTQAFNVASLNGIANPTRRNGLLGRTAAGHHRLEHPSRRSFSWPGRSAGPGSKLLIDKSYREAKEKQAEQSASRKAKKQAKEDAKAAG